MTRARLRLTLGIGVVAVLPACAATPGPSPDNPQAPGSAGPAATAAPAPTDNFQGHLVIIASCEDGTTDHHEITLTGYDPATWAERARQVFRIPADAALSEGQDSDICTRYGSDENLWMRDPIPARQAFNTDFSRMAVQIYDSGSTHVGYVDGDGHLVDLTGPAQQAYSSSVEEDSPVFDPNGGTQIWFTTTAGTDGSAVVSSRPVTGGPATRRGTISTKGGGLVLIGSPAQPVAAGDHAVLSPDGTRFAQAAMAYNSRETSQPGGLVVWRLPTDPPLDGRGGAGIYTTAPAAPEGLLGSCTPIGWADTSTVICDNSGEFYRVALPATPANTVAFNQSALSIAKILPDTDRTNQVGALSPDGKTIIFESGGDDQAFQVAAAPGSPVQQLPAAAAEALAKGNVIAWQ
ncbi:PD40 domain-containing protein [Amycolatopsis sp. FDAARGOS 1241]|uniref:PD40 domain-containing protein n=1 Tax=Amycolatopsis sp. FDAARGOS 1241 TaxID=2778070 RepID=UPI00194E2D23|nr:PD40 domain-containing protein [Amycolatopsis sp. FDAARGOS 1241]QRP42635.1 PD40 domain-containing protein [Amycolatopsis sp. FDAARGOS 1241]